MRALQLDYQFDLTTNVRTLKLLNIIAHTREAPAITVDRRSTPTPA